MISPFQTADPLFWIWALANFAVAFSYAPGIPLEMWIWHRKLDLGPAKWIVFLFCAFIVSCGIHHYRMPFSGHAHHVSGWDAAIDMIMAVTSVFTHAFLVQHRRPVIRTIAIVMGKYR